MTPLEISVAIHYWCFPEPYKGGPENWVELEHKIVADMIVHHLLEYQDGKLSGNTPAMRCFMEALQAVPWPSIRWVCEPSPVSLSATGAYNDRQAATAGVATDARCLPPTVSGNT